MYVVTNSNASDSTIGNTSNNRPPHARLVNTSGLVIIISGHCESEVINITSPFITSPLPHMHAYLYIHHLPHIPHPHPPMHIPHIWHLQIGTKILPCSFSGLYIRRRRSRQITRAMCEQWKSKTCGWKTWTILRAIDVWRPSLLKPTRYAHYMNTDTLLAEQRRCHCYRNKYNNILAWCDNVTMCMYVT